MSSGYEGHPPAAVSYVYHGSLITLNRSGVYDQGDMTHGPDMTWQPPIWRLVWDQGHGFSHLLPARTKLYSNTFSNTRAARAASCEWPQVQQAAAVAILVSLSGNPLYIYIYILLNQWNSMKVGLLSQFHVISNCCKYVVLYQIPSTNPCKDVIGQARNPYSRSMIPLPDCTPWPCIPHADISNTFQHMKEL